MDYRCEINLDECESTLEFKRSLFENTWLIDDGGDATLTFATYDDGFDQRLVSTNQFENTDDFVCEFNNRLSYSDDRNGILNAYQAVDRFTNNFFPNDGRARVLVFISTCEQTSDFGDVCEFEDEIGSEGIEVIKYNLGARIHENTYDCSTQNDEDRQFYVNPIIFHDLIDTSPFEELEICQGIPTPNPTSDPAPEPTPGPTNVPTDTPTERPTGQPTDVPTRSPSRAPPDTPTRSPTSGPTAAPTNQPTGEPTHRSTDRPTDKPTERPTGQPTPAPTNQPTDPPTRAPSDAPTSSHTGNPGLHHHIHEVQVIHQVQQIDPTPAPTNVPTDAPSRAPTRNPTPAPSDSPAPAPIPNPTRDATPAPTSVPTDALTNIPTDISTSNPTDSPASGPTPAPTNIRFKSTKICWFNARSTTYDST